MITLNPEISERIEGFDVGETVTLFQLDATRIGGVRTLFAPAPINGVAPSFGGEVYQVIPFESAGWSWSGEGAPPTPTLTFGLLREAGDQTSMATQLLAGIEAFDDYIGAKVLRIQTLTRFLDGGDEPDPTAHLGVEIYDVEHKVSQTPEEVTFQLAAGIDQADVYLPRRQAINSCSFTYRRDNGAGGFDYTSATCPYTGPAMFDVNGDPVVASADDRCGKRLTDCKIRFGANAVLPFGGFPGVGRVRL